METGQICSHYRVSKKKRNQCVTLFGKGEPPSGGDGATLVVIPDGNLRAVIEGIFGKASGAPITQDEMAALTRLEARNKNIRDLVGLEFATRLTNLDLGVESVAGEWVNSNEITNLFD